MKNIHILPTDKPSKLWFNLKGKLVADTVNCLYEDIQCQNIYITNSEEIKDGDWVLGVINEVMQVTQKSLDIIKPLLVKPDWKKIILTTDQDLIKDGVQAIDNEFLEWFVKNPSCEEVEVGYGWIRLTETDNEGYWISIPDKQFEMQQEEPKQDIEEAAERYITEDNNNRYYNDFIAGAKWQQERMYSEEEVLEILTEALNTSILRNDIVSIPKWFEQFSKLKNG